MSKEEVEIVFRSDGPQTAEAMQRIARTFCEIEKMARPIDPRRALFAIDAISGEVIGDYESFVRKDPQ